MPPYIFFLSLGILASEHLKNFLLMFNVMGLEKYGSIIICEVQVTFDFISNFFYLI